MTPLPTLLAILDQVLGLNGRALGFDRSTPLLGALPELDSMAVVSLLESFEQLGVSIDDGELDAAAFETVGSLADFLARSA